MRDVVADLDFRLLAALVELEVAVGQRVGVGLTGSGLDEEVQGDVADEDAVGGDRLVQGERVVAQLQAADQCQERVDEAASRRAAEPQPRPAARKPDLRAPGEQLEREDDRDELEQVGRPAGRKRQSLAASGAVLLDSGIDGSDRLRSHRVMP